jgi:hypothetical protein
MTFTQWVVVVVNMSLGGVLCFDMPMRSVAMLHGGVVVAVAMTRGEVLPSARSLFAIGAVVCHMHVLVVVLDGFMHMRLDRHSSSFPG